MRAVLFDFDGTLADSAPIITQCLSEVLREHAGINLEPAALLKYVGPPLPDTFAELGLDIPRMTKLYRQRYLEEMLSTPLFPGIEVMLRNLKARGVPVAVASSKPLNAINILINHLGIADLFDAVCGASPDETNGSKATRVAEALTSLRHQGVDTTDALMVGDRIFDIEGAAANGLRCVLVKWGEGPADEQALAWRTVGTVAALERLILTETLERADVPA
ncbi:HAD family hydrolase [Changpingibacter yushuensis]|uniref:HAD family hydrolase n=1 Tax=Changpingibacter yushuensis TaxID=2758440 RepID=UPI00165E3521|nr:HAD hydrolase-like protein [Changpingibacter yushuensis]